MKKCVFALALIAATCSGAVMAKDFGNKTMDEAAMDKVTAGAANPNPGFGYETCSQVTTHCQRPSALISNNPNGTVTPGMGRYTFIK